MRKSIKQFVKICAETLPCLEPIYEFGSYQVQRQVGFADLRPLFPEKEYIGADMRKGTGVDVILNLHALDLPAESVGTALMMDTLEHVEFPRKAVEEIFRVLKPGGILIMSSVMHFPIHDYPYDYWRFTPEGFMSLLQSFHSSLVHFYGEKSFPHTIVGLGFKEPVLVSCICDFEKVYKKANPLKKDWKNFLSLFASPMLWMVYRKFNEIFIKNKPM